MDVDNRGRRDWPLRFPTAEIPAISAKYKNVSQRSSWNNQINIYHRFHAVFIDSSQTAVAALKKKAGGWAEHRSTGLETRSERQGWEGLDMCRVDKWNKRSQRWRKRGRPQRRFAHVVKKDMQRAGVKEEDVRERVTWGRWSTTSYVVCLPPYPAQWDRDQPKIQAGWPAGQRWAQAPWWEGERGSFLQTSTSYRTAGAPWPAPHGQP